MKIFFSEFPADYGKYHFPYQVFLVKEGDNEAGKIYEMGFLPVRSIKNLYYLARSVRVNLEKFELSSENRRILRKTEEFEGELVKLEEFDYTPQIQKICKDWFEARFGKGKISAAAIRKIFTAGIFSHIFIWRQKEETAGYAVVFINEKVVHYAHVFSNPRFTKSNLGARMMLEAIIWAKENGKKYAYLGTCYEKNALYKTEFMGVEFFNGLTWSSNLEELKYLINRKTGDYLFRDKEFREKFYGKEIKELFNLK